ncbi:hypothetical protein [Oleiharenicola lentus]|uniref:hypothetical protein n=1 Tax=Oleiharenicola lentus TaxID=2508720 RepID=UPI003F673249
MKKMLLTLIGFLLVAGGCIPGALHAAVAGIATGDPFATRGILGGTPPNPFAGRVNLLANAKSDPDRVALLMAWVDIALAQHGLKQPQLERSYNLFRADYTVPLFGEAYRQMSHREKRALFARIGKIKGLPFEVRSMILATFNVDAPFDPPKAVLRHLESLEGFRRGLDARLAACAQGDPAAVIAAIEALESLEKNDGPVLLWPGEAAGLYNFIVQQKSAQAGNLYARAMNAAVQTLGERLAEFERAVASPGEAVAAPRANPRARSGRGRSGDALAERGRQLEIERVQQELIQAMHAVDQVKTVHGALLRGVEAQQVAGIDQRGLEAIRLALSHEFKQRERALENLKANEAGLVAAAAELADLERLYGAMFIHRKKGMVSYRQEYWGEWLAACEQRQNSIYAAVLPRLQTRLAEASDDDQLQALVQEVVDWRLPAKSGQAFGVLRAAREEKLEVERVRSLYSDGERALAANDGGLRVPANYSAPTSEEVRLAILRALAEDNGRVVNGQMSTYGLPWGHLALIFGDKMQQGQNDDRQKAKMHVRRLELIAYGARKEGGYWCRYTLKLESEMPLWLKQLMAHPSGKGESAILESLRRIAAEERELVDSFTLTAQGWQSPSWRGHVAEGNLQFWERVNEFASEVNARISATIEWHQLKAAGLR